MFSVWSDADRGQMRSDVVRCDLIWLGQVVPGMVRSEHSKVSGIAVSKLTLTLI